MHGGKSRPQCMCIPTYLISILDIYLQDPWKIPGYIIWIQRLPTVIIGRQKMFLAVTMIDMYSKLYLTMSKSCNSGYYYLGM